MVITFRNVQERLKRKIAIETHPKEEGGLGHPEAEILGEFAQEQMQELNSGHFVIQADLVWIHDTNELGRFKYSR